MEQQHYDSFVFTKQELESIISLIKELPWKDVDPVVKLIERICINQINANKE